MAEKGSTRKTPSKTTARPAKPPAQQARKSYVSQADVPRYPISEALRVANAIANEYGKHPTRPLDVAAAIGIAPTSGSFKMLTGASIAYGFTEGGAQADEISLTELGLRVVAPTEEGDDEVAKREGLLRPRVVREFLEKYDGSKLPRDAIAKNVLEQMGVTANATERTLTLIVESANELGLLTNIKGEQYVNLKAIPKPKDPDAELLYDEEAESDDEAVPPEGLTTEDVAAAARIAKVDVSPTALTTKANRKVFISHGKNKKVVTQIKELLTYGDFEPVVSVERETTSKPVPDKVMDDMRACGRASSTWARSAPSRTSKVRSTTSSTRTC